MADQKVHLGKLLAQTYHSDGATSRIEPDRFILCREAQASPTSDVVTRPDPVEHAVVERLPVSPDDIKVFVQRVHGKWYIVPADLPDDFDDIYLVTKDRETGIAWVKKVCAERANLKIVQFHRDFCVKTGEIC